MNPLDTLAYWFGASLLWLFALAVVATLTYFLLEFIGKEVYTRMRRVYHLTSVAYWLHHYEKRGRKCFLDPEPSSAESTSQPADLSGNA